VRRREKIHKSWDLAAQRKDGTSDDLDGSVIGFFWFDFDYKCKETPNRFQN